MKKLFEFCEKSGIRMLVEYDIHNFDNRLIFSFYKAGYACRRYVSKEELQEIPDDTLIESIINFVNNEFAAVIVNPKYKICPDCQGKGCYLFMGHIGECNRCNGTGRVLGDDYD